MSARIALLALTAGVFAASEAVAQNQYQQQIANQMTRRASTLSSRGYNALGQLYTGSINDDADANLTVTLSAGAQIAILGVCDNDCSDVDLQIYGQDGTKIGEDLDTDDYPVVAFTTQYAGTYRVRVMMATCNTNPCYYGVQVFANGGK